MESRSYYGEPHHGGGSEASSIVGTFLFGALLGAAFALLMAPKSGAELRSDIANEAKGVSERISEATSEATESIKSKINQIGSKAEQLGDQAEHLANEATNEQ